MATGGDERRETAVMDVSVATMPVAGLPLKYERPVAKPPPAMVTVAAGVAAGFGVAPLMLGSLDLGTTTGPRRQDQAASSGVWSCARRTGWQGE